ncbi:MAG: UDP-N-acetylmuramate--L-alanine ligase [Ruminococcaceae bacterium]|nr:UDP-N-acetylmuramate--L-alanine ligase [Oscillospiraceae bacterium]
MALENTHYGHARIGEMLKDCHSIFFIGIGGISMSALAQISLSLGYSVGGSDRSENAQTAQLRGMGIPVFASHNAANIAQYDAVVYTVAIGADNPEYLAAQAAGKPLLSRADYLGYLMVSYRHRIGIAGMHGKSSCTAMCAQIFLQATNATVLCGAELPLLGNSTCCIGSEQEHFVFEACEYMDSFLDFNPTLAVVLNVGMDHPDYFQSMEQIHTSFLNYARRTGKGGTVLYNADDAESVLALKAFEGRHVTFGIEKSADYTARNIRHEGGVTVFEFWHREALLCHIKLHTFGRHNVYNALAAAAAASLCGISPDLIAKALESYAGTKRRMEYKGLLNGATVYDDYGHHPVEIAATLSGAKEMGYKRILCAYQPHTYSRTAKLFEEFVRAFDLADRTYFVDIYAAREENVFGVSSLGLANAIGERAAYCGSFPKVAEALTRDAKEGDLVIIMGAGDIYKIYDFLNLQKS